jgi:pimeloyl-ACP methyl ester carboxylesterase
MFRRQFVRALVMAVAIAAPARAQGIDGVWLGVADRRPDSGLPVSVRLSVRTVRDSVRIELTLPESRQIALAIPSPYSDSSTASYRDGVLALELTPDIGLGFISRLGIPRTDERISFRGRLNGAQLVGRLRITTYESDITLRRDGGRPADNEQRIVFHSARDSLRLGGTLILPQGRGPFPAVVFVTGSDPDTRDAWRYEAEMLAKRGVASLLYDKRGVGESAGASHDLASWDDLAGDVEGALHYLRTRRDLFDARRLGLVGQSQGTWLITKVAARDSGVRFLVNISGSGISAAEQETYRTGALMAVEGFTEDEIGQARAFQRMKFAVARTGLGWERLDSTMQRLRAEKVRWFPGYGTGAAARSLAVLRLYGVLQFNYDPTRDLERIKAPTLVIMGERDLVFPPAVVVERMTSGLRRAGNQDVTTRVIPAASHGLMTVQTSAGKGFRRAISEEFLKALGDWVEGVVDR